MRRAFTCVKGPLYCFAMTRKQSSVRRPTEVISGRVRQLREQHGWSARELADRCAEAGMPELTRDVITSLETGRRASVSVDELFVLALVLDVAPVHLAVPLENERY